MAGGDLTSLERAVLCAAMLNEKADRAHGMVVSKEEWLANVLLRASVPASEINYPVVLAAFTEWKYLGRGGS